MKRMILIGAGHGNLEILKKLPFPDHQDLEVVVVSPEPHSIYSGLLPSQVLGWIDWPALKIPTQKFAQSQGAVFIEDRVVSLDAHSKTLQLSSGEILQFDVASINIGGTQELPPEADPQRFIPLRPFFEFEKRWKVVEARRFEGLRKIAVIGGGAASVEMCTALQLRFKTEEARGFQVELISGGERLCENYTPKISDAILKQLTGLGVHVHFGKKITSAEQLSEYDLCLWALPSQPLPFKAQWLEFDSEGHILIDANLRASDGIFAIGDCSRKRGSQAFPQSGVVAVRQGQHLARHMDEFLRGMPMPPFQLSKNQLNILVTGSRKARAVWGIWSLEGSWPLRLKKWIDQDYMMGFE